jgi:FKBP-type peptidyl-prolyl cis-trans isomerase FklB
VRKVRVFNLGGGIAMKLVSRIAFGMMLLATVSVAQDVITGKKANASSTESQTKTMLATDAAKQKGTQQIPKLTENDKRGYALGVELGLDVARQGMELNRELLVQGVKDALTDGKFLMSVDEMNATLATMQKEEHQKTVAAVKVFAEKNRKDGEAFLATNKAKDGVVTLASGLQYKVLTAADGKKPGLDDKVVCNYRGTLLDGTEVDSSYKRKEPSTIPLKGVIRGWTEALQLMPVGSKWRIFIPADLAYGERGDGRSIGPNATLIFEVELLSIQEKAADHANPQAATGKPQGSM